MTFATEKIKSGRKPCWVCEIDLDYCTRTYGSVTHEDTVVSYNDNIVQHAGQLDNAAWTNARVSITANTVNDPDGVQTADEIVEDTSNNTHFVYQALISVDGSSQYTFYARLKANTRTKARIELSTAGFPGSPDADFDLSLGTCTGSSDVDAAGITSLGNGWYTCWLKATSDAAAGTQILYIYLRDAAGNTSYLGDGSSGLYCGGVQLEKTTTVNEYQATSSDGVCVTLTTGGLTIDAEINKDAWINGTAYNIVDNGAGWIRCPDPTGEGTGVDVDIVGDGEEPCRATGSSGNECYNTRSTCESTDDWNNSSKTYSFSEPRDGIPASEGLIPSIRSVNLSPTRIVPNEGLGARGTATVTFQDHTHHDRDIDPYVANRSYTPEEQGTFWGKLVSRNRYHQGRVMRLKLGYIGDTFDLTNDFSTRTYLIERFTGPDTAGRMTVTAKDILKAADDDRAQAPVANTGLLDANITAVAAAATLTPAGVGNDEYSASGTLRIGSECMTFTRVADALTLTARGTDGTTAAAHTAGDSVQECLRYTDQLISAVIYDLLVNYAGVDSSYITIADWQAEEDDWLNGHLASRLITEPTGLKTILDEICVNYMLYLWWDERNSQIKFEIIAPYSTAPDTLTEAAHLIADSVQVTEEPDKRRSQVWVYYDMISATESDEDPNNYHVIKAQVDQDAELPEQYGESRIETIFAPWFTATGDAIRLASRLLERLRNNPRKVAFSLDMKDSAYTTGSVVALESSAMQDTDGSPLNLAVRIIEAREVDGHVTQCLAVDEDFQGRYARFGPNDLPDYDDATDEQKRLYGWFCENTAPYLDGDGAYQFA